jgi:ribosome-binding ATPase
VSLEIGVVGLPGSGKTTVFNALTQGRSELGRHGERPRVAMATVPDDRVHEVARIVGSRAATPATIRLLDVPGTGPALLGNLRRADAMLAVADGFSGTSEPDRDLAAVQLELLFADRDHVEKRLAAVRPKARSGEQQAREEAEALGRVLAHLESERALSEYDGPVPTTLEPLTTKPLVPLVNGPGGVDAKLELELAELPTEEAAAFREGPDLRVEVVRRLRDALEVITFFTANEKEARAWLLRRGATALDAAAAVHSDLAEGFVRCEVIGFDDLVQSGSRPEAARRGLQRLEGMGYVVVDGDLLQIRFTPRR